jgi:hypothetical protein
MLDNPIIKPIKSSGHYFSLVKQYDFYFSLPGQFSRNFYIAIRRGYRFDGASIPSALWGFPLMLSPAHPRIILGAMIHDLCYETKGYINKSEYATLYQKSQSGTWFKCYSPISKKDADLLFLNINKQMNMDIIRRNITYYAVRLFGRY